VKWSDATLADAAVPLTGGICASPPSPNPPRSKPPRSKPTSCKLRDWPWPSDLHITYMSHQRSKVSVSPPSTIHNQYLKPAYQIYAPLPQIHDTWPTTCNFRPLFRAINYRYALLIPRSGSCLLLTWLPLQKPSLHQYPQQRQSASSITK